MANKITYFFENDEVKRAFEACIDVIYRELSTSLSINLNEICTISEEEHSDDLYIEDEILVETHNLKELIEFFLNEFNVDARELYLSDDDIKDKYETILNEIDEDNNCYDFSMNFEKDTNLDTLFNILYARSISLEYVEMQYNVYEDVLRFEDFEYQEFFDAIEGLKPDQIEEMEYDHIGGDADDNMMHVDIYYEFKLNIE